MLFKSRLFSDGYDWDNASGVTDTDAYELAFLICLLPQTVNRYTI